MESSSLNQYIKTSLEYYDKQKFKYNEMINSKKINHEEHQLDDDDTIKIYNNNNLLYEGSVEYLGMFDRINFIWCWGWALPNYSSSKTKISRGLLDYGLSIEPENISEEHLLIKNLLVNTRIKIEEDIVLETNIAIISYLLRSKCKFIYPKQIDNYIYYLLVK